LTDLSNYFYNISHNLIRPAFRWRLAPTESASTYFYESPPIEREKKLINVFRQMRDYLAEKMENTTVADVTWWSFFGQ